MKTLSRWFKSVLVILMMVGSVQALDLVPIELCLLGAPPPVPTNVEASDGTYSNKVVVTYNTSVCASSYDIYRRAPLGLTYTKIGNSASGTYEDTSVTFLEHYSYRVKGVNVNGVSALSDADEGYASFVFIPPVVACVVGAVPPAPSGVTASTTYDDKIIVSNYATSCATSYDIYRAGTLLGAKTKIVDNTALTTFTDTAVGEDETYYYFVKANNANGSSGYSNVAIGHTIVPIATAPAAPSGVSATQGTYEDKVVISWTEVAGADRYIVYRNTVSPYAMSTSINWPGTAGSSYEDTNVEAGITYYYLVEAFNGDLESGPSMPVSGYVSEPAAVIPSVPASITASDGEYDNQISIVIAEVAEATSYEIYRSTDTGDIGSKIGTIASAAAMDTSVDAGVDYYYRAKACNSEGCSDYTMADRGYTSVASSTTIEETVADALIAEGSYTIGGTFGQHDFENVVPAFDWAFTTTGGTSYQLQGNAPTAGDVFGWKVADIPMPTPAWYMFALNSDIDGDGSPKFDWVLVYTDMSNKQVYKLSGVSATGNFLYSEKINVDYTVVGETILFTAP
jgi:fibronectin type 3 domain-containing protein